MRIRSSFRAFTKALILRHYVCSSTRCRQPKPYLKNCHERQSQSRSKHRIRNPRRSDAAHSDSDFPTRSRPSPRHAGSPFLSGTADSRFETNGQSGKQHCASVLNTDYNLWARHAFSNNKVSSFGPELNDIRQFIRFRRQIRFCNPVKPTAFKRGFFFALVRQCCFFV